MTAKPNKPRIRTRTERPNALPALAAFVALTSIAPLLGIRASPADPEIEGWYDGLEKPPFNPPKQVFAPVWTVLYTLIATSGWMVWKEPDSRERNRALALWAAQMALNAAWTPTFFGAKKTRLALADLVLLAGSAGGYAYYASRVNRKAGAFVVPYLGWLALAGALNEEIVRRNPR